MSAVLFEINNGIATITLNRPDKYNAYNREMAIGLQAALDKCATADVRVVAITGNGKAFCSGQDLAEAMQTVGNNIIQALDELYHPVVNKIRSLEKPVVALVNGVAAGAGASIALCCDIIIATESAAFSQAFSKIGLVPDSGSSYFLPRYVGLQKATALMMLGNKISAQEAESIGMIYKFYSDAEFANKGSELLNNLAQMPTRALALIKQELNKSLNNSLEEQLQLEAKLQDQASKTFDFKEGVLSFLEKRNPNFKGK